MVNGCSCAVTACVVTTQCFLICRLIRVVLCIFCCAAVLSEMNAESVAQQLETVRRRQCVYPACGKMLEMSSEKRCCALGVYCSSCCKEADWSRHKAFCEHSSVEEKLEGSTAKAAARDACAFCGKMKSDALKHCGRCLNISYCSKSCQQADWSRHKGVCQSQLPHSKPEASTSVAETRDGAEVKRECSSCGKASESLKHCTRCRKVSYCGKSCQQADWPRHKSMCADHEDKSEGVTRDACACCGKTSDTLKKCTGCRRVSYCDKNCQKAHRSVHKTACTQST